MAGNTDVPTNCPNCGSGNIRLTVVNERIDDLSPGAGTDWVKTSQEVVYRCGAQLQAQQVHPQHNGPARREVFAGCPNEEGALQKWCSSK